MSSLKRQSQNALAAAASCTKEKDFHNRTSRLTTQATGRAGHGSEQYQTDAPGGKVAIGRRTRARRSAAGRTSAVNEKRGAQPLGFPPCGGASERVGRLLGARRAIARRNAQRYRITGGFAAGRMGFRAVGMYKRVEADLIL